MSNTIAPIKPVRIVDPVVDFKNADKKFAAVYDGGSQSTWQKFPSTSWSQSNINFNINLPSMRTCVDRRIYLSAELTVTIAPDADPTANVVGTDTDAFRAYPLNSIIETMSCQIQNNNVSVSASDVYPYLLRYHNNSKLRDSYMSLSPHEMDQSQEYNELLGSIRNPLGSVYDSALGSPVGRGGFPYISFANSTGVTGSKAVIKAQITENVLVSPFIYTEEDTGIMGINQMNFVFNLKADLSRAWSRINSIVPATVSVQISAAPILYMRFITVKQLAQIPRTLVYNYSNIDKYNVDETTTYAAGSPSFPIVSQNIQFNSVPEMIYVFVRRTNSTSTAFTTDTFAAIDNISVEYNNVSGIFSNASPEELYMMSVSNGVNIPYEQWRGVNRTITGGSGGSGGTSKLISGIGSIIAINPAKDIGFNDSVTNGVKNKSTFQITVTARNLSTTTGLKPSLYVIAISSGAMVINDNNVTLYQGILSENDVLLAGQQEGIPADELNGQKFGGSFLSEFGKMAKFLGKFVKDNKLVSKGLNVASDIAPYPGAKVGLKLASDIADKLGAGRKKKGGAKMTRAELRELLD